MYENEIRKVKKLVGVQKMSMGLAITQVADSSGIPVFKLAQEMRKHAHASQASKKYAARYKATVPNRMIDSSQLEVRG
ncbi:MAG TPA: hypothetical protein PKI68_01105 [Pontiellaceae bacterium]|nr:hypothetical protein [Pontiellaceae bacterium]